MLDCQCNGHEHLVCVPAKRWRGVKPIPAVASPFLRWRWDMTPSEATVLVAATLAKRGPLPATFRYTPPPQEKIA